MGTFDRITQYWLEHLIWMDDYKQYHQATVSLQAQKTSVGCPRQRYGDQF